MHDSALSCRHFLLAAAPRFMGKSNWKKSGSKNSMPKV